VSDSLPVLSNMERLRDTLDQQHAIDGLFGEVFQELGGKAFLLEWAESNPGRFITLMTRMKPTMAPTVARTGELTINISPSLVPTVLDVGVVLENEDG
jgi:hypothetical protein